MSTQADRLVSLTQQLIGDIGRLEGVNLDKAGEAQLGQLLADAFEHVGGIALDDGLADVHREVLYSNTDTYVKGCGCRSGESCHTCLPLPGGITF